MMSESSSILACSKTQSNYTAIVSNQVLSNDKKNNQKIRLHQAPQNKINDLTMLCSFSEATVKNMDAATVCSLNFSLAKWSTSLYLENKASVARDHLGNNRESSLATVTLIHTCIPNQQTNVLFWHGYEQVYQSYQLV